MLNGAVTDPPTGRHPCPELNALSPFLRQYAFGDSGEIIGKVRPYGHPFLQDLEVLTIEAHSNMAAGVNTERILAGLFMNSPLLRRVEVKQSPIFEAILRDLRPPMEHQNPLTDNVEEVLLLNGDHPQDDMAAIVAIFPRLVSLWAEFKDGSARPQLVYHLPPEASEALLRVSETLETLSLTTTPKTSCRWANGQWIRHESYPSSLSTLNQMAKLKNLTTESIWLFGTEDPVSVAMQLPHLLPPSLVRLHLIDYWGNSDPVKFYPEFSDNWGPLEFYVNIFEALQRECHLHLSELREVTLASTYLCIHAQAAVSTSEQGQHEENAITQALVRLLKLRFAHVGVHFSIISPEESIAMVHAGWADTHVSPTA